ncbi:MAG: IS66 family insertion sequence element accessory protein TnpB, partial [Lachnospiraceae bacterium]
MAFRKLEVQTPIPDTQAAVIIHLNGATVEVSEYKPTDNSGSAACTAKRMLGDITVCENIYIACGYTDMRKSIDGLAAVVQQQFHLDSFSKPLFLFCGRHRKKIKALFWKVTVLS